MHEEPKNVQTGRKIQDLLPDGKKTGHIFRISIQDYTYSGNNGHNSWFNKLKRFIKRKMNKGWSDGNIH